MKIPTIGAALFAVVCGASLAGAQASYKKELPDSLAKRAKVDEAAAAAVAQKRVPKGTIDAVELEREGGKLIYSYDFKTPGKSGIDEVHVDAMTGTLLGMEHETPAAEKAEAKADAKAAAKKVKKP